MQSNHRPPKPGRARAAALLFMAALLGSSTLNRGRAADPQPYAVTLKPTGDDGIDKAAKDASSLLSLQDSTAVSPSALLARARADQKRLQTVLDSFGHYDGEVRITILDHALDDPALPPLLDTADAHKPVPVAVDLAPGPLYHLRRVELTGEVPPEARAAFALQPGAAAQASDVLAARDRLLAALRASGHALAKVSAPDATLYPQQRVLDVVIDVQPGPKTVLGQISITGLGRTNEAFVRQRLTLHQGDMFDPARIEAARQDLAAVPAFAAVRIETGEALAADGTLPVHVDVTERDLRTVTFGGSYSTDLGGVVMTSWTHRNLFGNAEQLTLSATATDLGRTGTSTLAPGYRVSADLAFPDWLRRDQTLDFNTAVFDESLIAYTRRGEQGGATVTRKLSPQLTASVGVELINSHVEQEQVGYNYLLLQLPTDLRYDTTDSPFDPTHGLRAELSLTPSRDLGPTGTSFVIAQASASTYLDVGSLLLGIDGRSVLATRGLVGVVEGASTFALPPDQRFYAGGGGTVRGFKFQSVGPEFPDDKPEGGTAVDVASVEYRQRILDSYGAAVFLDAGQVGRDNAPFVGTVHVGAGVGARYYTSFGPIRVDVAFPVTYEHGGDKWELYIGIGQSF
jgi:translocation and assembly module TamA